MSAVLVVLATLLAAAGFAALALAMDRHHAAVIGGTPTPARRRAFRWAGGFVLTLAAWACVHIWGPAQGAVGLWGVASAGAATVLLWLRWREPARAARPRSAR
ncbi:DUF3325 domain-containing protein [Luteimonas sp. S4-F44]|uniref:DUF3325 domain-containing protein n=1 Tax=Luteimonas sp. S4-F44 TaxID=2925842 RepID=UPI001F52EF38|nr:DUF3325 domain-containing protein [Luteimonas sp. S4-F44]UNK43037.1 DUF3325 domain-containing protein [Luteimonas sp. S4-F44]